MAGIDAPQLKRSVVLVGDSTLALLGALGAAAGVAEGLGVGGELGEGLDEGLGAGAAGVVNPTVFDGLDLLPEFSA